jgi:hypothetical protein
LFGLLFFFIKEYPKYIMIKSWLLSDNRWFFMLDLCSSCSSFVLCLIHFIQKNWIFFVFLMFNLFWLWVFVFGLF